MSFSLCMCVEAYGWANKLYIVNSHLDIQFWEPASSSLITLKGKSQSLMESASFFHTLKLALILPQTYVEKQHALTLHWPIKATVRAEEACGLTCWGWREKCISFRNGNNFWALSSGPREWRASSFPSYGERESKCHFPLQPWIITFMLWDRVCFFNMKNDILFGWDISLNA